MLPKNNKYIINNYIKINTLDFKNYIEINFCIIVCNQFYNKLLNLNLY